ncbi:probable galactinol--sucrose galactosyltransferase 1 [Humulus lupulus]|uniref:probable galactinol--sucrose galactosyltransferase 1 n=1 Tax=Humulus lupulus TaxID=3486 RepID=UPI002B40E036|nr:probable galactinol--sucrose galactosyltransferase 1 [Humulus lupulus]XP_062081428.1 probable galactinol--sucrose galactosyltransferase 1 [Humulus lupulus]
MPSGTSINPPLHWACGKVAALACGAAGSWPGGRGFGWAGVWACWHQVGIRQLNGCINVLVQAAGEVSQRGKAGMWFVPQCLRFESLTLSSVILNMLGFSFCVSFRMLEPASNGRIPCSTRAVGGCAIYVSDKSGQHDFNLLKKLVLPDGSILRARLPGRPTRDCLFSDPARDGKNLLKIWNMNAISGVVGAFNCQGAGWCKVGKKNLIHDEHPGTFTGVIRARDVNYLHKVAHDDWSGDAVIFSHLGGEVVYLPKDASLPVTKIKRIRSVYCGSSEGAVQWSEICSNWANKDVELRRSH